VAEIVVAAALVAAVWAAVASVVAVLAVLALGQAGADLAAAYSPAIPAGLVFGACHLLSLTVAPLVYRAFGPDRQIFATLFALIFPGTTNSLFPLFSQTRVFASSDKHSSVCPDAAQRVINPDRHPIPLFTELPLIMSGAARRALARSLKRQELNHG
jgi:hypothetical protein